jgi:1-deoxyxylulose-5-phosphate synthase
MRALHDLVRQGKVRCLGCSNLFSWQIANTAGIAARMNLEGLVAGQYLYNLIHRELERKAIPCTQDQGLGLVCYSPLGAGLLTGKYKNMTKPHREKACPIGPKMFD